MKTIRITDEDHKILSNYGKKSEDFEDIIHRLIEDAKIE
jgi:predicted CopG family antitoxin